MTTHHVMAALWTGMPERPVARLEFGQPDVPEGIDPSSMGTSPSSVEIGLVIAALYQYLVQPANQPLCGRPEQHGKHPITLYTEPRPVTATGIIWLEFNSDLGAGALLRGHWSEFIKGLVWFLGVSGADYDVVDDGVGDGGIHLPQLLRRAS